MFTYVLTPLGSVLLFLGTTHYLSANGRILGCSGAISTTFLRPFSDGGESAIASVGILLAPAVVHFLLPELWPDYAVEGGVRLLGYGWTEALAGLLVGLGTKFAAGCTSGHMLCGIPRLSLRSWISTGIFFSTAVATTNIAKTFPSTIGGLPPNALSGIPEGVSPLALLGTFFAAPLLLAATSRLPASSASRLVAACATGLTFGLGLMLSGMTSPNKILSFLSLRIPTFDPSLALVIAFAVIPNAIVWWSNSRLKRAITGDDKVPATLGGNISVVRSKVIDARLVLGSLLFGIGWGIAGICPGPGLIGAVANGIPGVAWLGSFLLGRLSGDVYDYFRWKKEAAATPAEREPLNPTLVKKNGKGAEAAAVASGSEATQ